MIALYKVHPYFRKYIERFPIFHKLGHGFQPQLVRNLHNGPDLYLARFIKPKTLFTIVYVSIKGLR